jgi:hypothetical protein
MLKPVTVQENDDVVVDVVADDDVIKIRIK